MLVKFILVTMKRKQEDKSQNKLEFNPRILQIDLTQDSKHLVLSGASTPISLIQLVIFLTIYPIIECYKIFWSFHQCNQISIFL